MIWAIWVIPHNTEEWCKICRKTDLLFQKWQGLVNFDLRTHNSQNFDVDWFLLCKLYNVWPKKVQRIYLSWHWRVIQNLERNRLAVLKLTFGIWKILTGALESLKNVHFNGLILRKVYIVWAKKTQRSYFSWHWHWRVMQNLERN